MAGLSQIARPSSHSGMSAPAIAPQPQPVIPPPPALHDLVDRLVADLEGGRVRSIAFVVPSDVSMTLPLYDVAIATARRGWEIGVEDARYWFITHEPEPLASLGPAASRAASDRLEPEGIVFVGSTYPDVRGRVVLLEPQGESIEVDRVVSLGHRV